MYLSRPIRIFLATLALGIAGMLPAFEIATWNNTEFGNAHFFRIPTYEENTSRKGNIGVFRFGLGKEGACYFIPAKLDGFCLK